MSSLRIPKDLLDLALFLLRRLQERYRLYRFKSRNLSFLDRLRSMAKGNQSQKINLLQTPAMISLYIHHPREQK